MPVEQSRATSGDGSISLLPAADPSSAPPRVTVGGRQTSLSATLFTYEWLIDGRIVRKEEPAVAPWPQAMTVSAGDQLRVLVLDDAAPDHIEVRVFGAEAAGSQGAPTADPVASLVCRRTPQQAEHACLRREPRGHYVELPPLPAGSYRASIFASWLPPADYWRRQGAARDPGELFASWLAAFRVPADSR